MNHPVYIEAIESVCSEELQEKIEIMKKAVLKAWSNKQDWVIFFISPDKTSAVVLINQEPSKENTGRITVCVCGWEKWPFSSPYAPLKIEHESLLLYRAYFPSEPLSESACAMRAWDFQINDWK